MNEVQILKAQVALNTHNIGYIPTEVFTELFEFLEVPSDLITPINLIQYEEQRYAASLVLLNEGIFDLATNVYLQRTDKPKYFEYRCELNKPFGEGIYQSWACKQWCRQCEWRDVRQVKEWESEVKSIATRYVPIVVKEVKAIKQQLTQQ
jgi:hypothetical protein